MAPVSRIESDEEECEIATGQSLVLYIHYL